MVKAASVVLVLAGSVTIGAVFCTINRRVVGHPGLIVVNVTGGLMSRIVYKIGYRIYTTRNGFPCKLAGETAKNNIRNRQPTDLLTDS